MGKQTGSPAARRGRIATCALLSLQLSSACLAASASPGGRPPAPAITEITLEHDCFGCATGSLLVLRRDRTATYTVTGKARHGTVDRISTGSVARKDFDKLAALLVAQGFFALKDEYSDPQTADGEWTSISAVRGGQEKKVANRGHAGPPSLQAIEKAIAAVRAGLDLTPPPPTSP